MTTEPLYLEDAYARTAPGRVAALTPEGGLVLAASLFYPQGGGQPGDAGTLDWDGGRIAIATTRKGEGGQIVLVPAEGQTLPKVGAAVVQHLDWALRFAHMRIHSALHLLSVVVPLPVTGGGIAAGKGRLDFAMPEPPGDKALIEDRLNALIARDLPITQSWITEAELDANPALVKTLSVQPPKGAGRIRLVRIGQGADQVDLQPCGGTHVAHTAQIGRVTLDKIENKGRQNRRITISVAG